MNVKAALMVIASMSLGSAQAIAAEEQPLVVVPPPPSPSECAIAPIDESALRPSTQDESSGPLPPPEEPTSPLSLFPNSESVGSEARKEIEALERQLAACYNAGDWRRAASLYTSSYLDRIVAAMGDRVGEFFPSEPEPLDRLDWLNVFVEDVRRIEDGQIIALINHCGPKQVHYYRQEADSWRLDDSLDVIVENGAGCLVLDSTSLP